MDGEGLARNGRPAATLGDTTVELRQRIDDQVAPRLRGGKKDGAPAA